MKKKLITGFLLSALCMTKAGAELTSEDVNTISNNPSASSYLVDLDGNGTDELIVASSKNEYETQYSVWQKNKKIFETSTYDVFLYIAEKDNNNYLVQGSTVGGDDWYRIYTVKNNEFVEVDKLNLTVDASTDIIYASHNGQSISKNEFYEILNSYQKQQTIVYNSKLESNSVKNKLLESLEKSLGYENVLSSLSLSEKTALFDDFLLPFSGYNIDYTTATDEQIAQLISDVKYDHDKFYKKLVFNINLPNYDTAMSKADADKLTSEIFGRKLDFSKLERDTLPNAEYTSNFCYVYNNMLCFRFGGDKGSFPGEIIVKNQKLYDMGDGLYYASYSEVWRYDDGSELEEGSIQNFVVRKNPDNTWRLVRSYKSNYMPTKNELESIKNPSSWAINEITAAQNENLVPKLIGLPIYKDNITRLQFAQLAVNLAENLTGQTLNTASANTFIDCNETAVLKAYNAGIINGTSQNTFSPNDFLTREQLATMLWRTAEYIHEKTNNSVLNVYSSLNGYTDANSVSAYAKNAVATLAKYGVMQGTSNTTLSPKNTCTVEQSILLIYRMYQKL